MIESIKSARARYLLVLVVGVCGLFSVIVSNLSDDTPVVNKAPADIAQITSFSPVLDKPVPPQQDAVSQVGLPVVADTGQQSLTFYPEIIEIRMLEDEGLPAREFVPAMQVLLAASDPVIRLASVESIAALNHPDIIPVLAEALNDSESNIRIAAIEGLAMQRDERLGGYIEPMLFDPDKAVRLVAINALADLEDTQAVPVLASLLSDYDSSIRSRVVDALHEIGGDLSERYTSHLNNDRFQFNE